MQRLKKVFSFFLVILSAGLSGCQDGGKVEDKIKDKEVVTWVNGKSIAYREFVSLLETKGGEKISGNNREEVEELKKNVLEILIEKRLILDEGRRLGIKIEDAEIKETIEAIKRDVSGDDWIVDVVGRDEELKKWGEDFEKNLLVRTIIDKVISPDIEVTEKEAADYYKEHAEEFERDEEFRAFQITVNTEEEAVKLLGLIKKGEEFRELAAKHSLSPDKEDGGDLGFFVRGEMPESFEAAVSSISEGEISNVVKSPFGYHIFKLIEKRGKRVIKFSNVREEIILS
ncbi:MAG: peptidylprolyl isomerase, partial [Thermodesulfobacteriota bacterium]